MSDKLFFKGRQDARQNHCIAGFKTGAELKPGSRKNPLNLIVTSSERKKVVQAQLDEVGLFADIRLDSAEGASENIDTLTILLSKKTRITREVTPLRNDPCSCGSGKKYKKCCA